MKASWVGINLAPSSRWQQLWSRNLRGGNRKLFDLIDWTVPSSPSRHRPPFHPLVSGGVSLLILTALPGKYQSHRAGYQGDLWGQ